LTQRKWLQMAANGRAVRPIRAAVHGHNDTCRWRQPTAPLGGVPEPVPGAVNT
jgi:hypothetical protein